LFGLCRCDKDLDGRITGDEVKQVIVLSASANKLSKLKEQAAEYAALIMEEFDVDRNGYIELSQLETLMRGTVQGFGKEAIVQYSSALAPPKSKKPLPQRIAEKAGYFFLDNWKRLWILTLWILAMAGLFTWKFIQYRNRDAFLVMGYCLCVAKGAAETLKLNMALILLPVCRNTLTRLRSTRLGKIIPFDDNLEFHKVKLELIHESLVLRPK
jgi:respiratory burst oxidase